MSREQLVYKSTEVYKEERLGMPLGAETYIRSHTETSLVAKNKKKEGVEGLGVLVLA